MQATIRRAVPADAAALATLRAAMFDAMGEDVGDPDAAWRAEAEEWFLTFVRAGEGMVVVADVTGSGVVACALGQVEVRAPSPSNRTGLVGHVSQVSTLPEHRRNGYARACVTSLVAWFDRTGITRLDLNATPEAAALYRELGFEKAPFAGLRRTAR